MVTSRDDSYNREKEILAKTKTKTKTKTDQSENWKIKRRENYLFFSFCASFFFLKKIRHSVIFFKQVMMMNMVFVFVFCFSNCKKKKRRAELTVESRKEKDAMSKGRCIVCCWKKEKRETRLHVDIFDGLHGSLFIVRCFLFFAL